MTCTMMNGPGYLRVAYDIPSVLVWLEWESPPVVMAFAAADITWYVEYNNPWPEYVNQRAYLPGAVIRLCVTEWYQEAMLWLFIGTLCLQQIIGT